jgi:cytoskeletal protein RodZ
MTLFTKLALGAAAVIVAVVLFVVLRPDGDDEEEATPTPATETVGATTEAATTDETTTQETTTEETTTEESTTTEPAGPPAPERITARFQDGEVVGGVKEAEIDLNSQVVVIVRSDVVDEVHVHGYDVFSPVGPGQPTRITFRADVPGRFDIELEDRALPLIDLRVRP